MINYLIRQAIPCTIVPVAADLGLDSAQCGDILSAFIFTYAVSHLFIGFIIDRLRDIRRFFVLMTAGMALCSLSIAFAHNYLTLLASCYLLGVFSAANFPLCLLIVSRVISSNKRTLATGIFSSGTFIATLVSPSVAIYFSQTWSWRCVFVTMAAIALIWMVSWLYLIPAAINRRRDADTDAPQAGAASVWSGLRDIVSRPAFWGVTLLGIGIVPCMYFTTQWLPAFFSEGLDQQYDLALGNRLAFIYLFQEIGMWGAGYLVLLLSRRGYSVIKSQRAITIAGSILMMSILTLLSHQVYDGSLMVFSLFTLGIGVCLAIQQTLKQNVLPGNVATVAALVGFIETLFASFFIQYVGKLLTGTDSYNSAIIMMGIFSAIATISALIFLRGKWITQQ